MGSNNKQLFTEKELILIEAIVRQCELFCVSDLEDCKQYYGYNQKVAINKAKTIMRKIRNEVPLIG